ncbi:unnamed protein product [Prunus armeniaca]|uniref:Anaphase-promoting complex subunit 4 WD40 domain-containing protein n=1 Tax=Prunus armeniaca TaxID=36596 RepID=A0A6J5WJA6_PRUAR|nr:unnamed protein product [Prunus armeniaca]
MWNASNLLSNLHLDILHFPHDMCYFPYIKNNDNTFNKDKLGKQKVVGLNTACVHVQWPKHPSKGVSFTKDGKFAAICTRRDCKDYINLLSCHTWEIMGVFAVDTLDLSDTEWSPDDSTIVIWDSPLEYKVLIYSPDGRCLYKYQAYESGLGVKSVSWSPCGQFLAVGSYDQMLRVLNHLTWKTFAEFMHLSTVRAPCCAAVFKEVNEPLLLDMSELCLSDDFAQGNDDASEGHFRVRYEVTEVPISLPFQKPPADKPNPKQGIDPSQCNSSNMKIGLKILSGVITPVITPAIYSL